jgi:hypothetical protein
MYAAHFAAGLAIKSRAPRAPAWAVLGAAFIPDVLWMGLAGAGIEPADPKVFFDDWSHSLASILLEATVLALLFYRRGIGVWLPVWLAAFSHFLLDLPIHPRPLALYPNAPIHLGWNTWNWGSSKSFLGATNYWWVQLGVTLVLLGIYARGARRVRIAPNLAAASCISVLGLHLLF